MDYRRINNAFEYAAIMHHNQRYKYNDEHHQIAHVSFVGAVLMRYGFPEDVVIAGILHDIVEDTQAELADVEKRFGSHVAELVKAETVDQSIPWPERQKIMQDNAAQASPEIKAIKLADVIHQLTLFADDEHRQSQINYFQSHEPQRAFWKYEQLVKSCATGWDHPMVAEARELLRQMKTKHLDK